MSENTNDIPDWFKLLFGGAGGMTLIFAYNSVRGWFGLKKVNAEALKITREGDNLRIEGQIKIGTFWMETAEAQRKEIALLQAKIDSLENELSQLKPHT